MGHLFFLVYVSGIAMYSSIDDGLRLSGYDADGPTQGPIHQGRSVLGTYIVDMVEILDLAEVLGGAIEKELKAFQVSLILTSVLSL